MRLPLLCAVLTCGTSLAAAPSRPAPATDSAALQRQEAARRASDASLAMARPPPTTNLCPGVISNGTVQLGVAREGHLYMPCALGTPSNGPYPTTDVGLRYVPTNLEAATMGIPCEGWGVASADLNLSGFSSASCGRFNVTVESYTVDLLGNHDICLANGTSQVIPVAVFYNQGQRVEYNCGDYGPGIGNLCNVIPGHDTCNPAVFENICTLPYYSCQ
ncbi:hypothetical protein JYJ95_30205 [Corallococcus exiguus]|uniref:hypothetical protein n=1 Tax=Corallococcus exiguus TaxID=83462 RepID=UPI001A8EAC97|nr:hypothetical protein [Corallococcus exiguus]MBN8470801.1 hypothetical protein [Corallococcus exiguus]